MSRIGMPMTMVSERAIARAVGDFAAAGIRVEGSAAAALAGFRQLDADGEPTVLVVTGRNIDDDLHRRAVEDPGSFPD
jgi:threonine synthase